MATPTEQIQTNIPSWLKDPILRLVAESERLAGLGYQTYARPNHDAQGNPVLDEQGRPILEGIQRTAGFNKAQEDAFKRIAAMQAGAGLAADEMAMRNEQNKLALQATKEAQQSLLDHGIELEKQQFLQAAQMAQKEADAALKQQPTPPTGAI